MSLKQSQWAWNLPIKPGPKFVLLALADFANDQGECYPSLKRLQKKCGFSRSTLIVHLNWLRKNNLIAVRNQHDKNGYRRQNFYQINSSLSPDFKDLSPNLGLTQVQNPDGNNINGHINHYKKPRGPDSGLRIFEPKKQIKSALEGAI